MGGGLSGCAQNPAFREQTVAPTNLQTGKAYVAFDTHEYSDILGRLYGGVATFSNVAVGKDPPYYPIDKWSLVSTNDSHHPGDIQSIEAGTYRLTFLGTQGGPTFFSLATSPVEFTVRPGELAYLGALEWHRRQTSSMLEFQPRYRFEFTIADEFAQRQVALQRSETLLQLDRSFQTHLMAIRTPSLDVQGHRPSLW